MVSVYSVTGLPWPIAFLGLWLVVLTAIEVRHNGARRLHNIVREQRRPIAIATGLLVILLLPQADRIYEFTFGRSGITGISESELGNLFGALPGWEAFGVWGNQDYRLPDTWSFGGIPWTGLVVVLVAIGAVWAIRRGRWMIPLAALGAMLIWVVSSASQSPYVSAKALVIASPLLALVAVLPLSEKVKQGSRLPWAPPLIAVLMVSTIVVSDLRALRFSPVGPLDHVRELESFRDKVKGKKVLFIGQDDFAGWALSPAYTTSVVLGSTPSLPLRPEKPWQPGQALDIDSIPANVLNLFEFVITSRSRAGSAPPARLRLVEHTRGYELWQRLGFVPERSVLAEGDLPGAILNCSEPLGLALASSKGVAAVRAEPVGIAGTLVGSGESGVIPIPLPPGRWEIDVSYASSQPIQVSGPGLKTELPASLDPLGQHWPLGTVEIKSGERPSLNLHVDGTPLTPASDLARIDHVVATPPGGDRVVALDDACGAYVDWYRLATPLEPVG